MPLPWSLLNRLRSGLQDRPGCAPGRQATPTHNQGGAPWRIRLDEKSWGWCDAGDVDCSFTGLFLCPVSVMCPGTFPPGQGSRAAVNFPDLLCVVSPRFCPFYCQGPFRLPFRRQLRGGQVALRLSLADAGQTPIIVATLATGQPVTDLAAATWIRSATRISSSLVWYVGM